MSPAATALAQPPLVSCCDRPRSTTSRLLLRPPSLNHLPPQPHPPPSSYEITKFEKPNYVELKGESDVVTIKDMITLTQKGDKTHVDYKVDLSLKGWRRPFVVFLNGALNKLGKDAMEGMRNTITEEKIAQLQKASTSTSASEESD